MPIVELASMSRHTHVIFLCAFDALPAWSRLMPRRSISVTTPPSASSASSSGLAAETCSPSEYCHAVSSVSECCVMCEGSALLNACACSSFAIMKVAAFGLMNFSPSSSAVASSDCRCVSRPCHVPW